MPAPYEIVASPLTVYVAPTGTSFPNVDTAPGVAWTKLGTSGTKNYDEDGVVVTHGQDISTFVPAGGTGPRKAFRTEEDLTIGFTLVDLTPEQYAKVINNATVTTTAAGVGTPGTKSFDLQRGLSVATFALLARGLSTVNDSLAAQYQVPLAYEGGEPAPTYEKGEPAGLELEFHALEDATLGFGKLVIQTAVAS
jgi:hypothetical protein